MKFGFTLPRYFSPNTILFLSILGASVYGVIAYFTSRTDFIQLISLAAVSFLIMYIVIEKSKLSFLQLCVMAFLYRLVFFLSIPNLSQDFFRFFWDGQLVLQGINPYAENVNYFFTAGIENTVKHADILRKGMGELNAGHYSNYPPISQSIYALSAWLANGSILGFIISLRLILISFDLLFIVFAKRLLKRFNINPKNLFWYILNPLCIMEITGNLHLEGIMISLFVVAFYFLLKHKYTLSALFLSLSISTKLLSLIFMPLVFKYFTAKNNFIEALKKTAYYGMVTFVFLFLQFAFFYNDQFISNFYQSIRLWFGKFEFNASVFYLIRWLGYQNVGWNIIETYGKIMPLASLTVFALLVLKFKARPIKILECFMWMLTVYFLLSTTVHPWYILFPLALSSFLNYKFVIFWSFVVILSYSAYRIPGEVNVSYWVLGVEYSLLITVMLIELAQKKSYLRDFFLSK